MGFPPKFSWTKIHCFFKVFGNVNWQNPHNEKV